METSRNYRPVAIGVVAATVVGGLLYYTTAGRETTARPLAPDDLEEVKISCLYIDRCLARLDAETDLLGPRAASVVESAERTLPLFWGIDPATLDAELRGRIDAYPAKIRGWVDTINEKMSEQKLAKIRQAVADFARWQRDHADGKWQLWIDQLENDIGKIQKLLLGMSDGAAQELAADIHMRLQGKLIDYRRGQLTAYQKDAIRHCHGFVNFVLTNTIGSRETFNDEFDKSQVGHIDSALLTSDARRIYDVAVGFADTKLRDRPRADFLLKLTSTPKWPLSDY